MDNADPLFLKLVLMVSLGQQYSCLSWCVDFFGRRRVSPCVTARFSHEDIGFLTDLEGDLDTFERYVASKDSVLRRSPGGPLRRPATSGFHHVFFLLTCFALLWHRCMVLQRKCVGSERPPNMTMAEVADGRDHHCFTNMFWDFGEAECLLLGGPLLLGRMKYIYSTEGIFLDQHADDAEGVDHLSLRCLRG